MTDTDDLTAATAVPLQPVDRAHPMAELRFEWSDWREKYKGRDPFKDVVLDEAQTFVRHWYQVPRVDDFVQLDDEHNGIVRQVRWHPDGRIVTLVVT